MVNDLKVTKILQTIFITIMLVLLYISSTYNYLLFHIIVEFFSICIAFTVFMISWNSSTYLKNNYLILIGIAYLFIGFLDMFHTISYKGMSIFLDYDYYANQLWIATRYVESITLFIACILLYFNRKVSKYSTFFIYLVITTLILLSIFVWKIFPICFIEGVGLTTFKKISEYIISGILFVALISLRKHKDKFEKKVYNWIQISIIFTIISELAFTFYIDNYGFSNLVGHYFKIFSFYLIYKAIIEKGVKEPYELIFRELKSNERTLVEQNILLKDKVNFDELTGLFNHRYLYEKLEEECTRSNKYVSDLSIIMLDIDHFKKVNDSYGHLMGDEVIKGIANNIKGNLRCADFAGRYGGEEFLIILPETNSKEAFQIGERIRCSIDDAIFNDNIKVQISGGVASYNGEKVGDFIERADNNLYKAKNQGRNRIIL